MVKPTTILALYKKLMNMQIERRKKEENDPKLNKN